VENENKEYREVFITSSPRIKLLLRMRSFGVKRGDNEEPFSMKKM